MTQYVAVKFNDWDRRSYTYHHDGDPLSIGDRVTVMTADGTSTVTVDAIVHAKPSFATKPIHGVVAVGQTQGDAK